MSTSFLNGFNIEEAASLNTSTTDLNSVVKQLFSDPVILEQFDGIVASGAAALDTQVKIVMTAREVCPALTSYTLQEVHDSIQRRLNSMSRFLSKKYGHTEYRHLSRGKIRTSEFAIEHQS